MWHYYSQMLRTPFPTNDEHYDYDFSKLGERIFVESEVIEDVRHPNLGTYFDFYIARGRKDPTLVFDNIFDAIRKLNGCLLNLKSCHKTHREISARNQKFPDNPQREDGDNDSYVSFFHGITKKTVRYLKWLRRNWPEKYEEVKSWLDDPAVLGEYLYQKIQQVAPRTINVTSELPILFISLDVLEEAVSYLDQKLKMA